VTGGGDKTARVWDVGRGAVVATLPGHQGAVSSAAFSADGSLVATGDAEGAVRVWESASGKLLYTLDRHEGAVSTVAFGEKDARLLTAGADGVRVWDVAPDGRGAEEIARDVACRVPLRLEGDVIVSATGSECR
jgi:WD40 repeat protein